MLHHYRSNRLEVLVDHLARLGPPRPDDPFTPETILIQTRGLERWLGMELAKRVGVFANTRFLSVEDYLTELCDSADQIDPSRDPWRPGRLVWPIAELLREARGTPGALPGLERWLEVGPDGAAMPRQVVELAWRIAEVFHRYTIHRPDMIARWTAGEAPVEANAQWQQVLWRRLVARNSERGARHLGVRIADLITLLTAPPTKPRAGLSIAAPRIILFGHHTLPPLFIDALLALAGHLDVHLFRLTVGRRNLEHPDVRPHPLRASLGRLADDLTTLLEQKTPETSDTQSPQTRPPVALHDLYRPPAPTTLLGRLQRAILNGLDDEHLGAFDPGDDSLQFHACSSELRQVEVLRDELLALFSKDPTIEPRDVIVMTPDIETYAPLVDAVFRDGDPNLPDEDPRSAGFPPIHRLHDRSLRRTNPVVESFLAILELVSGRHTLPQILDLVTLGPVLAKAGLEEEDLPQLQRLTAAAGIRWGDDEDHRVRHGQPRVRRNTWRGGFDRLLCGHAMASEGLTTWQGIVPVDDVEGKEVEQLGLFIDYVERLFTELDGLEAARTVPAWRAALTAMTERLLVSDDESAGLAQPIFDELTSLEDRARAGGFGGLIDFDAMKALIVAPFEARRPSVSFLSGGLTFCTLLPMRTIPFKVVALLGMDSGAFPRAGEVLGFDLMERDHQRGDHGRRDDDRMTFLETIVAAERHLIVTWTGLRATDRRELDAAGPVAELMETIRRGLDPEGAERLSMPRGLAELPWPLLVKHPLQPFTPSNFRASHPLSFDLRYLLGARQLVQPRMKLPAHWPRGLVLPEEVPSRLELSELARSIATPAEWFCQRRLGLRLKRYETPLLDREPIAPDSLERWALRESILRWQAAEVPRELRESSLGASGRLPIGAAEVLALAEAEDAASLIYARVREITTEPAQSVPLTLTLEGLQLFGTIDAVHRGADCRVVFRSSSLKQKDVVGLWVEHLALTAELKRPITSHLVCNHDHVQLRPLTLSEARDHLRSLLGVHLMGRRAPLPFFADTSWAAYQHRLARPDVREVPPDVRQLWRRRDSRWEGDSDSSELHVQLLFSDRLEEDEFPFADPGFIAALDAILGPLHPRYSRHDLTTPFVAPGSHR